jgi:hypothetical protein
VVHVVSSERLRRVEAKDGWIDRQAASDTSTITLSFSLY